MIKYEDLIQDTKNQLIKIIEYLNKFSNFEISEEKINNILKTTSFENFVKLENEGHFKESNLSKSGKTKVFFREGPNKKWQNSLNKKISDKIERKFFKEMSELGYLN